MMVSTDDFHDSKEAIKMLEGACSKVKVEETLFDGAYDSEEAYAELERRGILAVVKPRVVPGLIRAETVGYGRRWVVETDYSIFKRLFG